MQFEFCLVREPKKKVGEAVPLENGKRRKSGLGGSTSRGEPTRPAGKPYVANDDASNGSVSRNGQGVLRLPAQLEQIPVQPGDPIKQRGTRPGFILAQPYEPKSGGISLLRYRYARASKSVEDGKAKTAQVCLPLQASKEIVTALDKNKKGAKMVLESIEDFEAIMANPEWLVTDRAKQIEMIIGTMHARITTFKKNIE